MESIPLLPPEKYVGCTYCGRHNHHTDECHQHLMNTVAKTPRDMELLDELAQLETEALLEGIMVRDIPRAVEILSIFGTNYREQGDSY